MDFILIGKYEEDGSGGITKIWLKSPSELKVIGLFLFFDNCLRFWINYLLKVTSLTFPGDS